MERLRKAQRGFYGLLRGFRGFGWCGWLVRLAELRLWRIRFACCVQAGMQGLEKAQLRTASQNAATEIAVARRGAFRPSALTASPPYACVRACVLARTRACVRESSSEALAKLGEALAKFRASAKSRVISASGMPPKRVRTAYKPFFGLWVGCPTCSHRKRLKTALIAS